MMYRGTDELRSSCGGAGFHVASGLVTGFTDHAPLATFEGVNTLMSQQSARFLFKQVKKTKRGKKCKNYFEYINNLTELISSKSAAKSVEEFQSLDFLEHTLKVRSAFFIKMTSDLLDESKEKDVVKQNELFAPEVQKMAKYHLIYIMFLFTRTTSDKFAFKDLRINGVVAIVLRVFALKQLQEDPQGLYECGYLTFGAQRLIDQALNDALIQMKPHMLALTETTDGDYFLRSAIGNFHGDIYEAFYDFAVQSNLNKDPIPSYYEQYMKPLIQSNGDKGEFKL